MASFVSGSVIVTFTADADAYSEKREGRVAVQEIPGGDSFYVDRAGRRPLSLSVGLLLPNATAVGQLESVIAESGTLAIDGLDTHTAVLMSLTISDRYNDGQARGAAEFLVTDA